MDKHVELSYCCFEGFKLLARNYLDVGAHHVFDKIRALLEEVDMTPADVAENSMPKSAEDDADACLGNFIRALEMAKEERWKGGRRRRGIGATMKDDEELEMLLGEIPHATSLNLHNPHSNGHGHDHVHGGTLSGVDDDDPLSNCKFTCASLASGFSLQSDGSSSSLFSCGHSCATSALLDLISL
ncbi:hypothetical protein RJ639_022034 [Escallonia herrerae]|uniref:AAA+ ATPase At3g28540-like C-terminal domain-containing protein n=1 Tax=Escallonia herrerae TaxID=1293975 RepID=A0AA89AI91_9ASTE|nr:hypothetical protein RJ639_022034 [Escallonia herrerae]